MYVPRSSAAALSSQAKNFDPRVIAGRQTIEMPAGVFADGSPTQSDNPPRMVQVDRIRVCTTLETAGRWRDSCLPGGLKNDPNNHPIRGVSWRQCCDYISQLNNSQKEGEFGLPTGAELRKAIRGPAKNILEFMEQQGLNAAGFAEKLVAAKRDPSVAVDFENFVTELAVSAQIHNPTQTADLKKLIDGARALFAWQVYGTDDGLLTPEKAWYRRSGTAPVDLLGYVNPYGIHHATGLVWKFTGDVYDAKAHEKIGQDNPKNPPRDEADDSLREIGGGSWNNSPKDLPAAYRYLIHPVNVDFNDVGLLLFASAQD